MFHRFKRKPHHLDVFLATIIAATAAARDIRCGFSGNHAVVIHYIHTRCGGEQDDRN